ncbi:type 4a pilus biogenesis protein PilO [Enterovibrio norvegicus]|uniref:Pilus assembly protein PilO n=1 Tax=Enterovibrio norvegicus TaxID=188144 RepID=A0A2N7LE51_9GAMM|nr:type 4a pilus biogenesis protein PilO [Enterovibrio norvegicus]PMN69778.1 pilus assembly protein PilO [Enterovibrio norvegicus]PMN93684.1 pilus assembly protein PilO [Enterovibrio norvegicus]
MADWRDWDLDEIPEWSATAQNVLLGLFSVVALVAGAFLVVMPLLDDVTLAKQEESLLRTQFRIKAEKVAALPDVEEQINELQSFYDHLALQLPAEDELALLLAGINDTGLQFNLNFENLSWKDGEKVGWLYQVPLEMELSGRYHEIGHFSAALARMPRIVALQDFQLSRLKDKNGELMFSVSAHTYRYIGGQGEAR